MGGAEAVMGKGDRQELGGMPVTWVAARRGIWCEGGGASVARKGCPKGSIPTLPPANSMPPPEVL